MEVSGEFYAPAAITPGERAPGTHLIRGLMGFSACLDAVAKRKVTAPVRNLTELLRLLCSWCRLTFLDVSFMSWTSGL